MRMWVTARLAVFMAVFSVTMQATYPLEKLAKALGSDLEGKEGEAYTSMKVNQTQIPVMEQEINLQPNKDDIPSSFQNDKSKVPHYYSTASGRGRRQDGSQFKQTRVSRANSALTMFLFEPVSSEPRRRTLSSSAIPFNNTICITFAPNYADHDAMTMIRQILRYISDHLCVDFLELNGTINISDASWAKKNGCPYNSFVVINQEDWCYSPYGSYNGGKPAVFMSPCMDAYTALHEFMHLLTAIHSHQFRGAVAVISLFAQNIQPGYLASYLPMPDSYGLAVSAYTTLMYSFDTWSNLGEPTYQCMRSDRCYAANGLSDEFIIFVELNMRYQCTDYCGGPKVNCNKGMYIRLNGTCQCMCPERLDPATNCSTFLNGPGPVKTWPTQATMMAGNVNNTCPTSMSATGWMSICGNHLGVNNSPVKLPTDGTRRTFIPFCTVTSADSSDMSRWEIGGDYCFIKDKSKNCSGLFKPFNWKFNNTCPVSINGTVGDISINGTMTTMNFCCKKQVTNWMIDFPNAQPFRLWTRGSCPRVRGMRDYRNQPSFIVANVKTSYVNEASPYADYYILSYGFYWDICLYIPPTYDCSLNGSMGIAMKSVNYSSPGFPIDRPANKRCFICAQMAEDGFIRVTFVKMDLYSEDDLQMNRYDGWLDNSRIDISSPLMDVISDGPFICLELWTSWHTNVSKTGISLTMDTVLAAELCYNYSTNGADYVGFKNVSEVGEQCLNWADTRDCFEYPHKAVDEALGYNEANYCRNPYGIHRQPFCFVSMNGSNCVKRYCDVCNLQQPADYIPTINCTALIAANPNFCTKAIQRYSCILSCNLTTPDPTRCPVNYIPFGRRCLFFTTTTYNWTGAQALCASLGSSGTLLQIRSSYDSSLLRQNRFTRAPNQDTWVNGLWNAAKSSWVYTQTNITLMYTNWSSDINPYNMAGACAALYRDTTTTSSREGSFWAYSCTDPNVLLTVACQVDRPGTAACGQPVPPSDGTILESPKPSYYDGDRVTVQCKNNSNQAVATYMMCKGGNWTTLNYACSPCPKGWLFYKNLCTQLNKQELTAAQAEAYCNAQGANGTLFRTKTIEDHEYAKYLRNSSGYGWTYLFISGKFSAKGTPVYTGTNISVGYLNMTAAAKAACARNTTIYLYKYSSSSGRENSHQCTAKVNSYISICQIDARQNPAVDMYTSCQAALSKYPKYCLDPDGMQMCSKSCGIVGSQVNCTAPASSTYVRTSISAWVTNGDYMTFACVSGTFWTSGDLNRACGLGGTLLGQEPVCQTNPASIDVGRNLLSTRLFTLSTGIAVVFNSSQYRIPMSGKLSAWYCLTQSDSPFYFIVFRLIGSSYTVVGYNLVRCYPGRVWGVYIAPGQQINVQQGDMIGMYSLNDDTLQVTNCSYFYDNTWTTPAAFVNSFNRISTASFITTTCTIVSAGFTVSSNSSQGGNK